MFRNELVGADDLLEHRPALPGEVKRLGDDPAVICVRAGSAVIEVAAHGHDGELLVGPYRELLVGPYRELLGISGVAASVRTDPNGKRQ